MEKKDPGTPAKAPPHIINIQSRDHEKLLNVIDDLRSQGISRFIDLPQIIVCGDQSSGKSSVLEAVSGLKFPTKDNLCTRFATELILRRNPEVTSTATIVADATRTDAEKKRLAAFKGGNNISEELGSLVEEAGKAMGIENSSKVFSSDVLRIELSGPQQPHLTLVDLPGLFHSGSRTQSAADVEAVRALVTGYMSKPRSIILAVVSAKNDFNNQIVTKYATDYDPHGERTLGIITKPDTLHSGSDSEKQYFELAENKDVQFRLGWHVLKNRDYDQRNSTNEERNLSEKEFFSRGIWTSLGPKQLGIETLRPRLSRVLQTQILRELPSLMNDVDMGMKECQARLDGLGVSRGSPEEQRLHLHTVSDAFTTLMRDALNGRYDGQYFGDASTDDGYTKRIRAVTTNLLEVFAKEMNDKGHKYEVVQEPPAKQPKAFPYRVTKPERMVKVKELIKRNRGKELSTISKEDTITTLFREQSSPWVKLANKYAEEIYEAVRSAVMAALDGTCDPTTQDGVLSYIVNPALGTIKQGFETAVKKVLKQHLYGHPITYNHYLTENLQKARNEHNKEHIAQLLKSFLGVNPLDDNAFPKETNVNIKALFNALTLPTEADMTTFACSEALHVMEAYYKVSHFHVSSLICTNALAKVALKNFIDDFAIYAVEQELLVKVQAIFTPNTIFTLQEDMIQDIAGETEDSIVERDSSTTKLATLKKALDVLKRLDRGHTQGTFENMALT